MKTEKTMNRKLCAGCRQYYRPKRSFQVGCSIACRKIINEQLDQKRLAAMTKADVKPMKWNFERVKRILHPFILLRDYYDPCISCQRHTDEKGNPLVFHAGHYRTVAASPALRFHPLNIHKQCQKCNTYFSANQNGDAGGIGYRAAIENKLGKEAVEWLNKDHGIAKWTVEDCNLLIDWFKKEHKKLLSIRNEIK